MNNRKNIFWMTVEKLMLLFNGVVFSIILANTMAKEQFGIYMYIQMLVSLFAVLISLGLDNIVVRQLVNSFESFSHYITNILILRSIVFLTAVLVIFIYGSFFEEKEVVYLLLLQSIVLLQYVFNSLWLLNQATVDNIPVAKISITTNLFSLIFKSSILYLAGSNILYLIMVDVFFVFVLCFFTVKLSKIKYKFKFSFNKFDNRYIMSTLKESYPLLISAAAIVIYTKVDQFMLKSIVGFASVAEYSLALKVSQVWYFLPLIITSVYFPKLIKNKEASEIDYKNTLSGLYSLMGGISLLMVVFHYFITPHLIPLFFPEEYDSLSDIVFLMSLSGIFVAMGYVNGKWMICEKNSFLDLYRNILGLVFNILLNYILIPVYGIDGAAVSTLISLLISSNLSFVLLKRTRAMFIFQNKYIFYFSKIKYLLKS